MTYEEAIKILSASEQECWQKGYDVEQALTIVKEAVEKQIPKKPIPRYDDIGGQIVLMSYECPNIKCRNIMVGNGEYQFQHCEDCGQALDWSEDDERNS